MRDETREITGTVKQSRIAAGSKREHMSIVVRTPEGEMAEMPRDPVLEKLVGETITATGLVAGAALGTTRSFNSVCLRTQQQLLRCSSRTGNTS